MVTVANNGKEALDIFEKQSFDLILMDVQMPEMGGFEATEAIRKKEKESGAHTPIIAMTAHAMKGDREHCLRAGMDGYVSKPINREELFKAIEDCRLRIADLNTRTDNKNSEIRNPKSTIDFKSALARVDGDEELFKEMVELFLDDYPKRLSEMLDAISKGDNKVLERAAHTLKGSIGNFSVNQSYEAALKLEEIGRNGDLSKAEEACNSLKKEIERLKVALESFF